MDYINLGNYITHHMQVVGITTEELAEKMGVRERTVEKWKKGASCPDIQMLPQLAEILQVDSKEILKKRDDNTDILDDSKTIVKDMTPLVLIILGLAMGVATVVLSITNSINLEESILLIGIGLFSISVYLLSNHLKK